MTYFVLWMRFFYTNNKLWSSEEMSPNLRLVSDKYFTMALSSQHSARFNCLSGVLLSFVVSILSCGIFLFLENLNYWRGSLGSGGGMLVQEGNTSPCQLSRSSCKLGKTIYFLFVSIHRNESDRSSIPSRSHGTGAVDSLAKFRKV